MGSLPAAQRLPIALLALVVQHGIYSAFQIQLPHAKRRVAADIQRRTDLLVGPTLVGGCRKMRARVKVRALALPAWRNVYRDARSVSDSVTGMGCFIEGLLVSPEHLTPVNIFLD
jgi:hypothetical protein